ncbi:MAG: GYDIA family GHMP kinase [Bacteroidota bacterium]|uniref:GYDIA family GHMP kinase n=1 Tax=Flagellimonas okinawensis TaxID=3031324 RepID=A0ABT5XN69_9FLAO|nr:GYDIA family GHMP kinase [[Muricauda] okinawensis]MDF0707341.1 GYDIA family GHMP kinase [[Muricauda] okinawensis]MEC8832543.1 GYDIA family GHMP kinase [Bacteroidota bacterium]
MEKEFYSNGKLLLSGEYAILDGALGLAIPTSYGQSLHVTPTKSGFLEWTSLDENDKVWFSAKFDLKDLNVISCSDSTMAKTLTSLLLEANTQNPLLLTDSNGFQIETQLTFPKSWGLGTSSTLINNLAQWARVDAYQLLWNAFGGSGYDIACAQHNSPLTYQVVDEEPKIEEIDFDPIFKDSLFFVHLNQKQSSKEAIANYREQQFNKSDLIKQVSNITSRMIQASTLSDFESMMEEHETLLSGILKTQPVKQRLFPDYFGMVKSLGAWGGDFVFATGDNQSISYFKSKGYSTVIPYSKMVL